METFLGIDLGGTKLLIGEVDAEGHILREKRYPSTFRDQRDAKDYIFRAIDDYLVTVANPLCKPMAMGLGLVGRVDTEHGIWEQIDPSRTFPIEMARELTERYRLPAYIDNDVKSATRAELHWGVGRFSRNFVFINVGTGIAACSVVNGQLIRGSHFNAGEVGHTTVGVNMGTACACGRKNCVETIAAGCGFDICARLLRERYETRLTIPEDGKRVSVKEVYELSLQGDALCEMLVKNAAEALASLIMNLVRVTDPDTVVLGGSVVADGYLLEQMRPFLQAETMRFVTNGVQLTKLEPHHIGLLGAAVVAMNGKI